MKKFIIASAIIASFVSTIAFAAKPDPNADIGSLSYVFHLYYDNGQLFADRDFQIKYDVVAQKFTPEVITTSKPYKGEVISFKNAVISTFVFDPQKGNPTFTKGKISVSAPYAADALKVNFLDNTGKQILSIFVSDSSFCNDNGACDVATGENQKTCPNDCSAKATSVPIASTITNKNLPPVSASGGNSGLVSILTYVVAGLAAVAVAWFGWKWWKNKKSAAMSSDSSNSSPLPPPPVN